MIALRGGADFRRALEHGARCSDQLLAVRALRRADDSTPAGIRVGISVGRRFGKAVQRNRVRRWLRESARALLRESREAWDLVLMPRSTARMVTHDELRASLSRLLRRAGARTDND